MQVFVARQPIFDARQRVVAYELLFRSSFENYFPNIDGDVAAARVIGDAMTVFGLASLTNGKRAYINITRRVLCEGLYGMLPPRGCVLELLESIESDREVEAAVRAARARGYQIALDDFVERPQTAPLVGLADVIKVDFLSTSQTERRSLRERPRKNKLSFLAEKVETAEEFKEAARLGYSLFQGYFFQRPQVIAREDIPPAKLTYVQFLRELQRPELDFDALERWIKHDVSLSVRLLRYLNSAQFGWKSQVTSLKHALVLLGERHFRKWASLIAVVGMTDDRPPELTLTCLTRARFAEFPCPHASGLGGRELDAFLTGLLSALDAVVGRPMKELLADISVSRDVDAALLGTETRLGQLRALVMAYEHADWSEVGTFAKALGVNETVLPELYRKAVEWATEALPMQGR